MLNWLFTLFCLQFICKNTIYSWKLDATNKSADITLSTDQMTALSQTGNILPAIVLGNYPFISGVHTFTVNFTNLNHAVCVGILEAPTSSLQFNGQSYRTNMKGICSNNQGFGGISPLGTFQPNESVQFQIMMNQDLQITVTRLSNNQKSTTLLAQGKHYIPYFEFMEQDAQIVVQPTSLQCEKQCANCESGPDLCISCAADRISPPVCSCSVNTFAKENDALCYKSVKDQRVRIGLDNSVNESTINSLRFIAQEESTWTTITTTATGSSQQDRVEISHVTFKSQFSHIPQILLGVQSLNIISTNGSFFSFNCSARRVTQVGFDLDLRTRNQSAINSLLIQYFAFEPGQIPGLELHDITITSESTSHNKRDIIKQLTFQQNQSPQSTILFFLTAVQPIPEILIQIVNQTTQRAFVQITTKECVSAQFQAVILPPSYSSGSANQEILSNTQSSGGIIASAQFQTNKISDTNFDVFSAISGLNASINLLDQIVFNVKGQLELNSSNSSVNSYLINTSLAFSPHQEQKTLHRVQFSSFIPQLDMVLDKCLVGSYSSPLQSCFKNFCNVNSGFYYGQGDCLQCEKQCQTCSDNAANCLTCSAGRSGPPSCGCTIPAFSKTNSSGCFEMAPNPYLSINQATYYQQGQKQSNAQRQSLTLSSLEKLFLAEEVSLTKRSERLFVKFPEIFAQNCSQMSRTPQVALSLTKLNASNLNSYQTAQALFFNFDISTQNITQHGFDLIFNVFGNFSVYEAKIQFFATLMDTAYHEVAYYTFHNSQTLLSGTGNRTVCANLSYYVSATAAIAGDGSGRVAYQNYTFLTSIAKLVTLDNQLALSLDSFPINTTHYRVCVIAMGNTKIKEVALYITILKDGQNLKAKYACQQVYEASSSHCPVNFSASDAAAVASYSQIFSNGDVDVQTFTAINHISLNQTADSIIFNLSERLSKFYLANATQLDLHQQVHRMDIAQILLFYKPIKYCNNSKAELPHVCLVCQENRIPPSCHCPAGTYEKSNEARCQSIALLPSNVFQIGSSHIANQSDSHSLKTDVESSSPDRTLVKNISFATSFSSTPDVQVFIKSLDFNYSSARPQFNLSTTITSVTNSYFLLEARVTGSTQVFDLAVTYVASSLSKQMIELGNYLGINLVELDAPTGNSVKQQSVTFQSVKSTASTPPNIFYGISGIAFDPMSEARVNVYPSSASASGFTMNIETSSGSRIPFISVSWASLPKDFTCQILQDSFVESQSVNHQIYISSGQLNNGFIQFTANQNIISSMEAGLMKPQMENSFMGFGWHRLDLQKDVNRVSFNLSQVTLSSNGGSNAFLNFTFFTEVGSAAHMFGATWLHAVAANNLFPTSVCSVGDQSSPLDSCQSCATTQMVPPLCISCAQGYYLAVVGQVKHCYLCINHRCSACASEDNVCSACAQNRVSPPSCPCPSGTIEKEGVAHCFSSIWPTDVIIGFENSITEASTHTLKEVSGLTYSSPIRVETRHVTFHSNSSTGDEQAAFSSMPTVVAAISQIKLNSQSSSIALHFSINITNIDQFGFDIVYIAGGNTQVFSVTVMYIASVSPYLWGGFVEESKNPILTSGSDERTVTRQISFYGDSTTKNDISSTYTAIPFIAGFNFSKNTNSRLITEVSSVDADAGSFTLDIQTFGTSQIWYAKIYWLVVPESYTGGYVLSQFANIFDPNAFVFSTDGKKTVTYQVVTTGLDSIDFADSSFEGAPKYFFGFQDIDINTNQNWNFGLSSVALNTSASTATFILSIECPAYKFQRLTSNLIIPRQALSKLCNVGLAAEPYKTCVACISPRVNPPYCTCPEYYAEGPSPTHTCSLTCDSNCGSCLTTPSNCQTCANYPVRQTIPECSCANPYSDGSCPNVTLYWSAFTTTSFTNTDVTSQLTISGYTACCVTQCQSTFIIGGYNQFGYYTKVSKSFSSLPVHSSLRLRFRLWILDNWSSSSDSVTIRVDGVVKQVLTYNVGTTNICGANYGDQLIGQWIDLNSTHYSPVLLIEIFSNLNLGPSSKSWGVRDFYLYLKGTCANYKCSVCSSADYSLCTVCGGYRDGTTIPTCSCSAGYYDDGYSVDCKHCSPQCETCLGFADNCTLCIGNRQNPPSCNCPDGTYASSNTIATCMQCSAQCAQCNAFPDNCTACAVQTAGPKPFCGCPAHTFYVYNEISSNIPQCQICSDKCSSCVGEKDKCLSCSENRVAEPDCICPSGYFDDGVGIYCPPCSYKCMSCQTNESNCIKCSGDRVSAPQCNCSVGQFDDGSSALCRSCGNRCSQCLQSKDNCSVCADIRINPPDCACPPGHYEALSLMNTSECRACFFFCVNCTGSQENCTVCAANREFAPVCTCPYQTVQRNETAALCCSFRCAACSNTANNCIACIKNRINIPTCVCPVGTYDDNHKEECQNCTFICAACIGNATNCTTCRGDRTPPLCSCPNGFYEDFTSENCVRCPPLCLTCDLQGCLTCRGNRRVSSQGSCDCTAYSNGHLRDGTDECSHCSYAIPLAYLSDDFGGLLIGFNYTYNGNNSQYYKYSQQNCRIIFSSETMAKLGISQPSCQIVFTNESSAAAGLSVPSYYHNQSIKELKSIQTIIEVHLGSSYSLQIGQAVEINPYVLRLLNCNTSQMVTGFSTVNVQLPFSPMKPEVQLDYLLAMSPCSENLITVVSEKQEGLRGMATINYAMVIVGGSNSNNKLQTVLDAANAKNRTLTLVIPQQTLQANSRYTITITSQNWLNYSAQQNFTVNVTSDIAPSVVLQLSSPSGQYYVWQDITVNAQVHSLRCSDESKGVEELNETMILNFIEESNELNITRSVILPPGQKGYDLKIPQFTAQLLHNYTVLCRVELQSNPSLTAEHSISFSIKRSKLVAFILGGSRLISFSQSFQLLAFVQDPDEQQQQQTTSNDSNSSGNITVTWQCTNLQNNAPCILLREEDGQQILLNQSTKLDFPPRVFQPFTAVQFTLTAYKAERSVQHSIFVMTHDMVTSNNKIDVLYPSFYNTEKVNIGESITFQIVLGGSGSSSFRVDQLIMFCTLIYDNEEIANFRIYSLMNIVSLTQYTELLHYPVDSLLVKISVLDTSNLIPAQSSFAIQLNFPPKGGVVQIQYTPGANSNDAVAMQTKVNISVSGVFDEDANYPLTFQYAFYRSVTEFDKDMKLTAGDPNYRATRTTLTDFIRKETFTTVLPSGNLKQTVPYTLMIIVVVSDSLGASSFYNKSIVVKPSSIQSNQQNGGLRQRRQVQNSPLSIHNLMADLSTYLNEPGKEFTENDIYTLSMYIGEIDTLSGSSGAGCLTDCSSHGACQINGKCLCNNGFYLADCSLTKGEFNNYIYLMQRILGIVNALILKAPQHTFQEKTQEEQLIRSYFIMLDASEKVLLNYLNVAQIEDSLNAVSGLLQAQFTMVDELSGNTDEALSAPADVNSRRKIDTCKRVIETCALIISSLAQTTSYYSSTSLTNLTAKALFSSRLRALSEDIALFYSKQNLPDESPKVILTNNIDFQAMKLSPLELNNYIKKVSTFYYAEIDPTQLQSILDSSIQTPFTGPDNYLVTVITYRINPYTTSDQQTTFPYPDTRFPLIGTKIYYQSQLMQAGIILQNPIYITFVVPRAYATNNMICIALMNSSNSSNQQQQWSEKYCYTYYDQAQIPQSGPVDASETMEVDCQCSFIGDVTVVDDKKYLFHRRTEEVVDEPDFLLVKFNYRDSAVFYFTLLVTGLFIIFGVIGWLRDRKDSQMRHFEQEYGSFQSFFQSYKMLMEELVGSPTSATIISSQDKLSAATNPSSPHMQDHNEKRQPYQIDLVQNKVYPEPEPTVGVRMDTEIGLLQQQQNQHETGGNGQDNRSSNNAQANDKNLMQNIQNRLITPSFNKEGHESLKVPLEDQTTKILSQSGSLIKNKQLFALRQQMMQLQLTESDMQMRRNEQSKVRRLFKCLENEYDSQRLFFFLPYCHFFYSIIKLHRPDQSRLFRLIIYYIRTFILLAFCSLLGRYLSLTVTLCVSILMQFFSTIIVTIIAQFCISSHKIHRQMAVIMLNIFYFGSLYWALTVAVIVGPTRANMILGVFFGALFIYFLLFETVYVWLKMIVLQQVIINSRQQRNKGVNISSRTLGHHNLLEICFYDQGLHDRLKELAV